MNYLFVCTANQCRSRTAEVYFQNKYPHYNFRSAGINRFLSERHGGVYLKRYMCEIADYIFCMEDVHRNFILEKIDSCFEFKTFVLRLGDTEKFMSESLINILEKKMERFNL